MKKPTIKEYLSLSTGNIPLKKYLTAKQLAIVKAILLGKPPSLHMVTGSRCSGRSTALAITSILHAMHGDGNVLAVASDIRHCNVVIGHVIEQWIHAISPNSCEWEIQHHPMLAFVNKKTGATIFVESMKALHRMVDPYYFYVKLKKVGFIWIEDLEDFDFPMRVPTMFDTRSTPPCRIAVNYQVQSWHDNVHRAVSKLKLFATSRHTLMICPHFASCPEMLHEIRRIEAARRQMLKASNFYKKMGTNLERIIR